MKIIEIHSQNRRDFYADYECEGCGAVEKRKAGYDDDNFHQNVIPNMKCKSCGRSARELDVDVRPLATKHPEGFHV